jgi:hypothetical protein
MNASCANGIAQVLVVEKYLREDLKRKTHRQTKKIAGDVRTDPRRSWTLASLDSLIKTIIGGCSRGGKC